MPEFTNPSVKEIKAMIARGERVMMFYHISKEEVLNKDFRGIAKLINTLKTVGKGAKRSLMLTCNGYDDVTDELYEIKEVREFVQAMFDKYPYLLYYITDFTGEADVWLLNSLADEVHTISSSDRITGDELWEKYGVNWREVPRVYSHLTFKAETPEESRFFNMLKAIIRHGKLNKDARGGKKIAIEYAIKFDNTERTLAILGITDEEVRDIMN